MTETRGARPGDGAAQTCRNRGSDGGAGRGETRAAALKVGDRRLLALVEAATDRARAAAGAHLVCRTGCTPCCFGPFAVTQLDAWRLRNGLRALAETDPEGAGAVRRRAAAAVARQAPAFAAGRAGIFATEEEEERFYEMFASDPCPALDPDSGACTVYAGRPIACRTYGPPVRRGGDDLPPCPLCFKGAAGEEVEAARQTIDTGHVEDPLTGQVEEETGRRGMTTIAFAIAGQPIAGHVPAGKAVSAASSAANQPPSRTTRSPSITQYSKRSPVART